MALTCCFIFKGDDGPSEDERSLGSDAAGMDGDLDPEVDDDARSVGSDRGGALNLVSNQGLECSFDTFTRNQFKRTNDLRLLSWRNSAKLGNEGSKRVSLGKGPHGNEIEFAFINLFNVAETGGIGKLPFLRRFPPYTYTFTSYIPRCRVCPLPQTPLFSRYFLLTRKRSRIFLSLSCFTIQGGIYLRIILEASYLAIGRILSSLPSNLVDLFFGVLHRLRMLVYAIRVDPVLADSPCPHQALASAAKWLLPTALDRMLRLVYRLQLPHYRQVNLASIS